jgi:hypothetical protein
MPRVRQRITGSGNDGADGAAGAAGAAGGSVLPLYEDRADHATTGTSEETLDSFSVPAGTLANDGDYLRVKGRCIVAGNANSKTLSLKFGATTVATLAVASNGESWDFEAVIRRSGAATQVASGRVVKGTTSAFSTANGQFDEATPAETLSGAVTLAVDATTPTSSGDLTLKEWSVVKVVAPGGTIAVAPAVPPALYSDQADHATAGTTEETLDSFVLPADTLAANGDGLRITAVFATAANGNAKNASIDFGGTQVAGVTGSINNSVYVLQAEVWQKGASSQIAFGESKRHAPIEGTLTQTAPAEDETGTITIAVRGETATQAGDLTLKAWRIEKITAPA